MNFFKLLLALICLVQVSLLQARTVDYYPECESALEYSEVEGEICFRTRGRAGSGRGYYQDDYCIDCQQNERHWTEGAADIINAFAGPLAVLGSSYLWADATKSANKAWARADRFKNQSCTNRFNSYLDYTIQRGASPVEPQYLTETQLACNGSGYGAYAGFGGLYDNGFGGFGNPFLSAGFSPGLIGGMIGPYGAGGGGNGLGGGLGVNLGLGLGGGGLYGGGPGGGLYGGPYGPGYGGIYGPGSLGIPGGGLYPGGYPGAGGGLGLGVNLGLNTGGPFYGAGNGGNIFGPGGFGSGGAGIYGPGGLYGPGGIYGSGGIYGPGGLGIGTGVNLGIGMGPGSLGLNNWGIGPGGYWQGTGGFNNNSAFWNQQYQAQLQAQQQYYAQLQQRQQYQQFLLQEQGAVQRRAQGALVGDQLGRQALYQNAQVANANLIGSYRGGGTYQGGYLYGGSPYSAGNLGLQFSLGIGAGAGFNRGLSF